MVIPTQTSSAPEAWLVWVPRSLYFQRPAPKTGPLPTVRPHPSTERRENLVGGIRKKIKEG